MIGRVGGACNLMSDVEGREKVERTQVDCQCAHARSCPVNSTCVLVGAWSGSYFSESSSGLVCQVKKQVAMVFK